MAKTEERLQARKLRLAGKSIKYIAHKVGVSTSSVSIWCSDIELSPRQIAILIKREGDAAAKGRQVAAKLKRAEKKQRMSHFRDVGQKKIGQVSKHGLFLVGASLYWAEGSKKRGMVVFANSDPGMIKVFLKWLEECLGVAKNRLSPFVSINQAHKSRIDKVGKYWSEVTNIPLENFTKPSYKKVKNVKFYDNFEDHYGTLFVRVKKSTNLNYEILGYIEGLKLAA